MILCTMDYKKTKDYSVSKAQNNQLKQAGNRKEKLTQMKKQRKIVSLSQLEAMTVDSTNRAVILYKNQMGKMSSSDITDETNPRSPG